MTTKSLQATSYQRAPIRVVNGVLRLLNGVGVARADMDIGALMEKVSRETGLNNFGDESFLEPLRVLLKAYRDEADMNPIGQHLARSNVLRLLKGRLYTEQVISQNPQILQREIGDPVVIVGLGRSGTTRLHRLLAADDRFLHLKSWESVYPAPYPECFDARAEGTTDPRITTLEQALKAVLYMSPQIAAVHPLGTFEVEEEIGLLQHAFATQLFEILSPVPSFAEYLMTTDQTPAYQYLERLLKVVSWFRDDPPGKTWLLKSPQHMQDLDALLTVFPGARILCPHRDPVKVVGSLCSMAWNSMVRDNDNVKPEWVGQEWLTKTQRMVEKTDKVRATLAPEQQYDLLYADISADWESSMDGVYHFLGMPFTDQARSGMRAWLEVNRQHKHGAHKYTLAEFGLNAEQVERVMGDYRTKYAIPKETSNPHLQTH